MVIDPQLDRAVVNTDLDRIRELVTQGVDLEATDSYGQSALFRAVASADQRNNVGYTQPEAVLLLLELGADPNTQDRDGYTPLFRAIRQATSTEDPIARALLHAGADPTIRASSGRSILMNYAASPQYAAAGLLFADVRASRDPLHLLAERGATDELATRLGQGADPDERDTAGYTPLAGAVSANQPDAVDLLLHRGANPNLLQGPKQTPLLNAAIVLRRDEVIAALVAAGADPDLPGASGTMTARMLADKVRRSYF